jgi:hypothetical protein
MATPKSPNHSEHLSGLDRRQMLISGAALTMAVAVPPAGSPAATNKLAACPESSVGQFGAVTARRLREIARRNEIRQEARLPLLSVAKELRRMKDQARAEAFRCFEAEHSRTVWEQVLTSRREGEGSPNWRPGWSEGVRLQNEIFKILRTRFQQQQIRAECCDG